MKSHSHPPKVYRGSRKRFRRIRVRAHSSVEFWVFVVVTLLTLFTVLHWIVQHPATDSEPVKITR